MPTVFVYEYCCARRPGRDPRDPAASLAREGRAMRDAVAADFRKLPGYEVLSVDDLTSDAAERTAIQAAAGRADATLLIAPETDGLLEARYEWAAATGTTIISPSIDGIRAAARKSTTAAHWLAAGVPTPRIYDPSAGPPDYYPVVVKPDDGAGSEDTSIVQSATEWEAVTKADRPPGRALLTQEYVPGRSVSVAFLVGPAETVPLLPMAQLLSADGRLRYEGGEGPLDDPLASRAVALGRRAVEALPGLRGWVGADLVLGAAVDGSEDLAIEVNPRLTTSYVGLRHLAAGNLADAMLRVATGRRIDRLRWNPGAVRFRPDGFVEVAGGDGKNPKN